MIIMIIYMHGLHHSVILFIVDIMDCCTGYITLLSLLIIFSTADTTQFNRQGMSLSEIPEDIPLETTQIILKQNAISHLNCSRFDNLSSVHTLSMEDNQLTTMPPRCFHGLSSLQILRLARNQIGEIYDTSLSELTRLSYIDISYNLLTYIPQHFFRDTVQLRTLILKYNAIVSKYIFLPLSRNCHSFS